MAAVAVIGPASGAQQLDFLAYASPVLDIAIRPTIPNSSTGILACLRLLWLVFHLQGCRLCARTYCELFGRARPRYWAYRCCNGGRGGVRELPQGRHPPAAVARAKPANRAAPAFEYNKVAARASVRWGRGPARGAPRHNHTPLPPRTLTSVLIGPHCAAPA